MTKKEMQHQLATRLIINSFGRKVHKFDADMAAAIKACQELGQVSSLFILEGLWARFSANIVEGRKFITEGGNYQQFLRNLNKA